MKSEKEAKISYWAAHLTTIVSVTLVLLIIGVIALISLSARTETKRLREQIELSAIMTDTATAQQTRAVYDYVRAQPYTLSVRIVSKEEALKRWMKDTGENLEQIFGVNPLSAEVSFSLRDQYASKGRIASIARRVESLPGVEGVASPDASMVESMNSNIERLAWILGGMGIVLIIISFVLINNTVHLSIYSRRFTIHTMQLVGATNGFIRRPFVNNNMLCGLLSGLLASTIICGSIAAAGNAGITDIARLISWPQALIVCAALAVIGVFICGVAASIATTRYLHKDYDELFR